MYHAPKDSGALHCAFVFDTELLESLQRYDRRIEFIWDSITALWAALQRLSELVVRRASWIALRTFKDQVVFEKHEALARDRRPFSVLTAYRNAWLQRDSRLSTWPPIRWKRTPHRWLVCPGTCSDAGGNGVERSNLRELRLPTGTSGGQTWFGDFPSCMDRYQERGDYPALRDPSYLSVQLRFGTVSIRELVAVASSRRAPGPRTWLSELIWREL